MNLIKLIVQLWIAVSIIKAVAASNQRSYSEGFENGTAYAVCDDEEPPYSLAFREVA